MISVEGLSKEFNGFRALHGVTLRVERGEAFGLIGPNGAGKTTLVRILSGQIPPDSGEIRFEGEPVNPRARLYRLKIGLVPQEAAFYGRLTARENLQLMGLLHGMERGKVGERAGKLLEWSGLAKHAERQARIFSRGMQQRLSLVMGLMHEPELIYLDEPTSGLDPEARVALWQLILRLSGEGKSIFITTHNMEEADRICGRLALLVEGSIREEGTPAYIKGLLGKDRIEFRFTGEDTRTLDDLCRPLGLSWRVEADRAVITGENLSQKVPAIVGALGPDISDLRYKEVTLDDAFLYFMRQVGE